MSAAQFIKTEGGEELVILTRRDYDALLARAGDEAAEDAMSVRIVEDARASGEVALPESVWNAIEAGTHPLAAIRGWRGMTQSQLAAEAGCAQAFVSAIESGSKTPSVAVLGALAKALRVKWNQLLPDAD